jgi:hypothetical protein
VTDSFASLDRPIADWDFDRKEQSAVRRVAKSIKVDLDPAYDKSDIEAEALCYIATAPRHVRDLPLDHLVVRVRTDVLRATRLIKRKYETSLNALHEQGIELSPREREARERPRPPGAYTNSPRHPAFEGESYQPADVEAALPGLWHDYLQGIPSPFAPEHDMPKAAGNAKTANTHFAVLVDMKNAWENAGLKYAAKRRLFMRFGLDWTQEEIAEHEGTTKVAAKYALERNTLRLTNYLNGTDVKYEDGGAPMTAKDYYTSQGLECR